MIEIAGGAWRAVLLPERGGSLAALSHAGRDVLVPLPPGADPNDTWAGAFVMLPWANRLDEGRLPHPGGLHRFPCNRVEERTALHGFAREHPWTVERHDPDRAVLSQSLTEGPYAYEARLEVSLGESFRLSLSVTNQGADGTPYGTGWHPFLHRPPGTRLAFRATGRLTRDARNLPLAREASPGIEGGEEVFAGLDTHFTGWDGTARLRLGERGFVLRGEGAWARNLQVFAPAGAGILCVEPASHVPDAANRPDLAPLGAMRPLARGEALDGAVVLQPS